MGAHGESNRGYLLHHSDHRLYDGREIEAHPLQLSR